MKRTIYADHAATTPLSPNAQIAMTDYLSANFYNPSAQYAGAQRARKALEQARGVIAECIGAEPEEIYFTSGGTEADNWALKGTAFRYPMRSKQIITTSIEHHAVLNSCVFLERMGYGIRYLPVDRQGLIDPVQLEQEITPNTVLVSVMMANNEIGTIQPVAECAKIAHACGAKFHTDAVQAVGHIPIDVAALGIDMLSASAHKFGGPRGIGFLYIRKGTRLERLLDGGRQEYNCRAGTENVAGAIGMAAALQESCDRVDTEARYLLNLRCVLCTALRDNGVDFHVNGGEKTLPGTISLSFKNMSGEVLLHRLDLMGIQVATGAACNSKETQLSHVLKALHLSEEYAKGTIRVSLGAENSEEDVLYIAAAIQKICGRA